MIKHRRQWKYPHEIYPQLLEWEVGDLIVQGNKYLWYNKYHFVSINEDGNFIVSDTMDKHYIEFPFSFLKKVYNNSLKTRREEKSHQDSQNKLVSKLKNENGYFQFLKDFRQAYKEISK